MLSLASKFDPAHKVAGKDIKEGVWFHVEKPFKQTGGFKMPVPDDFRQSITNKDIRKFLKKFDSTGKDLVEELAMYGLSYKLSFMSLAAEVSFFDKYADTAEEILTDIVPRIKTFAEQAGDTCRLLGNSSQLVKLMREREYQTKMDASFVDFLKNKKANLSKVQKEEENLRPVDDERFIRDAKSYR